jgi:hypothetical protein
MRDSGRRDEIAYCSVGTSGCIVKTLSMPEQLHVKSKMTPLSLTKQTST